MKRNWSGCSEDDGVVKVDCAYQGGSGWKQPMMASQQSHLQQLGHPPAHPIDMNWKCGWYGRGQLYGGFCGCGFYVVNDLIL